jgi:hypothetical protein
MASALADAPSGADKAGRRAFLPRQLRTLGRTFLRNADKSPQLHAADEIGSAHDASPSARLC